MIEAAVTADQSNDIDLGHVRHGHTVVEGSVDDLPFSLGETLAQFLGVGRNPQIDRKPVLAKKPCVCAA